MHNENTCRKKAREKWGRVNIITRPTRIQKTVDNEMLEDDIFD